MESYTGKKAGRINDTVGVRYSKPRYKSIYKGIETPLLLHALISGVSSSTRWDSKVVSEGKILRGLLNEHVREATNVHVCYLRCRKLVTVEWGRPF